MTNTQPETFTVTRDGEHKGGPFASYLHAVGDLHRVQGQSAHHATTYGGWSIVPTGTSWDNNREAFYTVTAEDVGRATLEAFGRRWRVSDFLGRVFAQDIGKRVYLRADILQAESNEQRDRRTQPAPMTVAEAITNERSPSR